MELDPRLRKHRKFSFYVMRTNSNYYEILILLFVNDSYNLCVCVAFKNTEPLRSISKFSEELSSQHGAPGAYFPLVPDFTVINIIK